MAGELILRQEGHDAASEAVGGLYWRYEQWIRKCEALFDSPVGVYGGFYAIRRELFVPQPAGMILDDMFQPLSIIRQGYRSVLDSRACVYDTWPKKVEGEFHRKVRTLAGNFQLFQLAPWTLSSAESCSVSTCFAQGHAAHRALSSAGSACFRFDALGWVHSSMRSARLFRFSAGLSLSPACGIGSRYCIASRLRPVRCWCSMRPPWQDSTNSCSRAARSGRYGTRVSRLL